MKKNSKLKYEGIWTIAGINSGWIYNSVSDSHKWRETHCFEYNGYKQNIVLEFTLKNDKIEMSSYSYKYDRGEYPRWVQPNLKNGVIESMIKEEWPEFMEVDQALRSIQAKQLKEVFGIRS